MTGNHKALILAACAGFAVIVGVVDQLWQGNVRLGILYFLPLIVVAALVHRAWVIAAALAATFLTEHFGPGAWNQDAPERTLVFGLAFLGVGLAVSEFVRNQRLERRTSAEVEAAARARSEDVRALLEGSPGAVLVMDSGGVIVNANGQARRLLGFEEGSPEGEHIRDYLPLLANLLRSRTSGSAHRTMVEASGQRRNGEPFFASVCVSIHDTHAGSKLVAVITDATEQAAHREEAGLRQLVTNSRVVASAVSHEIRDLAATAARLHQSMQAHSPRPEDYTALGSLIERLQSLSSADHVAPPEERLEGVDVSALFDQLRVILRPAFAEYGVALEWEITDGLPRARGDYAGLLQVFISLAQASGRALQGCEGARLRICGYRLGDSVVTRFAGNGPAVPDADRLFQPFQSAGSGNGLELHVARAMVRTFGGELHYVQRTTESCFVVELPAVEVAQAAVSMI